MTSGGFYRNGGKMKHWHGATPDTAMTHIAIAESLDGNPVVLLCAQRVKTHSNR
ncbi:Carboxymuconolactone decarboxylase [Yersinia rohdei ATCC 43380]|nr:Carboxymuconolactone decarboxylase [Yersinia rohdei ATCC 43380]